MTFSHVAASLLACCALIACNRAPTPPPAAPAAVAPSPAPPPTKKATMICRNSQTGADVKCGTPNAVLVGVKTD